MQNQPAISDSGIVRPAVMSLAIRERAGLYAAYMPFLVNGGIFVPNNKICHLGEEIFLLLSLMKDENPPMYRMEPGRMITIAYKIYKESMGDATKDLALTLLKKFIN